MKHIALFTFFIIAVSCKKENIQKHDNPCGVQSAENLDWLKQEILNREQNTNEFSKYLYIQQGIFNGQTIFIYNNCCPFCLTLLVAYDCEGRQVENFDFQKVTDIKIIWKAADSVCVFY